MGFLLPFLPAIIGAGGSIAGSLIGRHGSGGELTVPSFLQPYIDSLNSNAGLEKKFGKRDLRGSNQAFNAAENFWNPIASGDRTSIMQFLGPELSSTGNAYNSAINNLSQFGPRSGGKASAVGNIAEAGASKIGDIILGARPAAANALAGIGSARGSIGSSLLNSSSSSIGQIISGLLGGGRLNLEGQQLNAGSNAGIGNTIGQLLGTLILGGLGKRKGGGSSGGYTPGWQDEW